MRISSMNDQKIQIRLTWKLLSRSWWNFHTVYTSWRGLRGWSTMSDNKSKMADSGHFESQAAHWSCTVVRPKQKSTGKLKKLEPLHWFLRWIFQTSCFRPKTVLCGSRTMSDVIQGKYAPKTPQKPRELAVSSQNAEIYTSQYLQNYYAKQLEIWGPSSDHKIHYVGGPRLPRSKLKITHCRHLENQLYYHYSAKDGPNWIKFGTLMQNSMPITVMLSKLKPKAEFQYGKGLFFKPEIVISQPRIEIFRPNLVCW